MAKFRASDGTEIDLGEAVTDAQVAAIGTIVADSVTGAIAEAIKPVAERLDAIESSGGGAGDDDDGQDKDKGKGDPVLARLDELTKSVSALAQERESERAARTTAQAVKAYLDANHPNMDPKRRAIVERRAVAAAPKDAAAIRASVEEVRAEWADAGADVAKAFGAAPGQGGATSDTDAAAEKAARIKKIRAATPEVEVKG